MNNDLISRSEAERLGATCLARRNENGQLEAIISLDNAPTVEPLERIGSICEENCGYRPQGKWIDVMYADNGIGVGKCNQCGIHKIIDNFCPNCGADMRKGGAKND